jgi:hypothetical protein
MGIQLTDLRHLNPSIEFEERPPFTAHDMMALYSIRMALSIQEHGARISKGYPMGTTMARKMLGIKGDREKLLEQVDAIIALVNRIRDHKPQEDVDNA